MDMDTQGGVALVETLEEARQKDQIGRVIKVLILVKTTPTPSDKYEDTVCVAGLALSPGPPRWVRLYPIPFRHLDPASQFTKYEVITVKVGQPSNDPRAESLRVDVSTIESVRKLEKWADRIPYILGMEVTTACALNAGTRADPNAASLGIVQPYRVKIDARPHRGWTSKQRGGAIDKWVQQEPFSLDGLDRRGWSRPLEPPPLVVWYSYTCEEPGCTGHRQGILDWELTALQRKAQDAGKDVEQWVRERFDRTMFASGRKQWFILGNNAAGNKRASFSVLSVFWPPENDVKEWRYGRDRLF